MAKNSYFKFKQFTIHQQNTAMKVGTDGVLLGAWVAIDACASILDVGTGTGMIALMLAQRSNASITAIEIEENAALQAKQNIADSAWGNRVNIKHISLQNYVNDCSAKFDLIVSNPPFFSQAYKAANETRTMARHNDTLPFEDLIADSVKLLNDKGRFAVVLPFDAANEFERLAEGKNLFIIRKTEVKPTEQKVANRVLLEFSKQQTALIIESLIIYDENRDYTEAYKKQTKDFYLKF